MIPSNHFPGMTHFKYKKIQLIYYSIGIQHKVNRKNYQVLNAIFLLIIISGLAVLVFFPQLYYMECLFRHYHHVSCPACGIVRAGGEFLQFHFETASKLNPYAFEIYLFFALQVFIRLSIVALLQIPLFRKNYLLVIKTDIVFGIILFVVLWYEALHAYLDFILEFIAF